MVVGACVCGAAWYDTFLSYIMDEKISEAAGVSEESVALSKAERKRLRRAEKTLHRERELWRRRSRRWLMRVGLILPVLAIIGFFTLKIIKAPAILVEGLVSKSEVHWHARLDITVRGENMLIPANIGIPAGQTHPENMHTHAEDHVIHIEKLPPVYEQDLKLANFFTVWGKQFNSQCVMDTCVEGDEHVKLLVNGKENALFENYLLQDGDEIEIVLE